VTLPSTHFKFQPSGAKGLTPNKGIQYSNVWGDVTKGAHGAFFQFDPGFTSYVHTHTYDYYAVVIKGDLENYKPGETPVKLGPGSYWYQRGKEKHTTACVSKTSCEIYIVQSEKFDAQNFPNE
jgi:quercetin dioxygenase-like cupin family protein